VAAISPNVSSEPQLGTGSKTDFAFNFSIVAATDIGVYVDGVRKSHPSDYTVIFGDVSGTVTFTSPPPNGAEILLVSEPDYLQTSEFADQGAYNLSTVNTINRRAAIRELVNNDLGTRALKVPRGEGGSLLPIAAHRANGLMGFNDVGDAAVYHVAASSLATISSVAGAIVDVAANATNINSVVANATNINTVAGNTANITAVAGIAANITTVASISNDIASVVGNTTNVNIAAANINSVRTVATNVAAVNLTAANMAAVLDAPNQAVAAAAAAGAIGTAAGLKDVTLGFTEPLLPGNVAWPADSTIWAFTSSSACTLKSISTQVNAVNSGALNLVIATGTLPGPLAFVASYPLATITTTGINTWVAGSGWTGTISMPAGAHALFSLPSGGADLQQQTALAGYTRYTSNSPFTTGNTTLLASASIAIRVRAVVTTTTLQVPRAGLVDAAIVTAASNIAPAAARVLSPSISTAYGATMTEVGNSPFSANQVATIATATANGVLETLSVDVPVAGNGVMDLVILNGALPVVEKVSTIPLTAVAGRNVYTSAQFGTINLLAGQTVMLATAAGGPLFNQIVKAGASFYYGPYSTISSGAGTLTLVPDFQIRSQITVLAPALVLGKQNLGSELQGLSDLARAGTPLSFAIFPTGGQSNMQGANPQINPEVIPSGWCYQWYNGALTMVTRDSIGNASISSSLVSFVNRYIALTGEGVILVPSAVGGSGLAVTSASGNWSSTGTLRAPLIANLNAAKAAAALTASFTASIAGNVMTVTAVGSGTLCPGHIISGSGVASGTVIVAQLSGVAGSAGTYTVSYSKTVMSNTMTQAAMGTRVAGILWSQGETDADTIDAAGNALTGGLMTGAKYEAEFALLNTYFQAQAGGGIPIIMSRTGFKSTGDTVGYQAIRAAQENLVRANANVSMGYVGAVTWQPRGEIQSTYHGTTIAYAEMGKAMATCAAYKCAGRA